MSFHILCEPPGNVVQVGDIQSFRLAASDDSEVLERVNRVEWRCVGDPDSWEDNFFSGSESSGSNTWENVHWEAEGEYWIVASVVVDGYARRLSLPVCVVSPDEIADSERDRGRGLARSLRIVADPPLRTVSPDQRMTFRIEVTAKDPRIAGRIRGIRWYCLNDPSHSGMAARPWSAGGYVFGGTGWQWTDARWDFVGHHRILAMIDHDGGRIDLEYPVHVVSPQAVADMAPAFGEETGAPEIVCRQMRAAIEAIRAIERRRPPPPDASGAYEKRMERREEYVGKLRGLLDPTRGKERFPIRAQYYSPHNARPGGSEPQWLPLNAFLCEYEPDHWMLVDWTNPASEVTCGIYDGWFGNRNRTPQEAISGWAWHNRYPEGIILYEWDADYAGHPLRADRKGRLATGAVSVSGRFETDGASLAGEVSQVFDYIAFGAAVLAGVTTLVAPVPGSRVISAGIWTAIFSSTAAATINIAERRDDGFSNMRGDVFDALTIAANLLGAGAMLGTAAAAGAMARGAVVSSRSLGITRGVIFASFGVEAIQGIIVAEASVHEVEEVMAAPGFAPDERLMALVRVVGQLAGTGALLMLNLRGTRRDAANLTLANRHIPPEPPPRDLLDRLKDPKGEVDLDARLRRSEGTTAEEMHTTTVQTTPGRTAGPEMMTVRKAHAKLRRAERLQYDKVVRTQSRAKRGPVLSVIIDRRTGEIFTGQNRKYPPKNLHPLLQRRIAAYKEAVANKKIVPSRYENGGLVHGPPGCHSEVYALNDALQARERAGLPVSEALLDEFVLSNVRLKTYKGSGKMGDPIVRCPNCTFITHGLDSMVD